MSHGFLTAENLSFAYNGHPVLKDFSMDFRSGVFYAVIGPNGCGKSTLIKNLYGYLRPDRGRILIGKRDLHSLPHKERARHISYVPQETHLGFDFTVHDIVSMGRNPYHMGLDSLSREDHDIIENAMHLTGVQDLRNKSILELSGGEKQSAIIARALAQNTDVILLDEPVSSLDIHHQVEIMDIVKDLTRKGKTVICVLHDMNLTAQYADILVLIHEGRMFARGTVEEVLRPDIISQVYRVDVLVEYNKEAGRQILIPLPKSRNSSQNHLENP